MDNEHYDETIVDIIDTYNSVLKNLDNDAQNQKDRAYGGMLRSNKGNLLERITHSLIMIAWKEIGGKKNEIKINKQKIKIPIKENYLENLEEREIKNKINDFVYKLSVDKHIYIKGKFVIAIECKAYTENAMLKRILVDFSLLKKKFKDLKCFLFQLESQLGGDFSSLKDKPLGSFSTHTLMSYFDFKLNIVTFLEGERKVDRPIHKYFKPLDICFIYLLQYSSFNGLFLRKLYKSPLSQYSRII